MVFDDCVGGVVVRIVLRSRFVGFLVRGSAMARSVTGVVAAASVAVLAAGVLTPVGAQAVAGAELSVPVVSADSTPQVRGDIAAGVPVSQVKVLRNGKKITAKIRWNQGLINGKGNSDRFNVRLVVFPTGDGAPIVLTNWSKTTTPPPVQKIRIKLSKNKAKKLRAADDAVLTVSQQHGKTKSKRFNRAYVTVTKLTATNGRALSARSLATDTRAGRDCMTRLIRPGANLAGCDLAAASLRDGVISRANLTGADLSAGLLSGSVVKKTKLAGSDLSGVDASGLTGTPASLPAGWSLVNVSGGRVSLLSSYTCTVNPDKTVICYVVRDAADDHVHGPR